MEEQRTKKCYNIFILMFITLNVLATYFVTTQSLNRYIINFNYTFKGIMNSIIGNVAFLLLVVLIVSVAFKKVKSRIVTLLLITLLLNGGLFAINVYNRFYGTSFTFKALAILKNPAEGFGLSLVFESLRELVTYYRIILFIPIIVLVIIYSVLKRKVNFNTVMPNNTIKQTVTKTLTVVALFLTNILVFSTEVQGKEIVDSAKATYATQNIGLYNYLFLDVIGFDYNSDEISIQDVKDVLDSSNKNKDVYTNILDGKEYTKEVSFKNSANVSGALVENLNPEDSLTGLLSGYNLVLIHLESFNHFLLELNQVNKYLYNLQALMSESYVFENFFTNVGLGTSFDAEIAVLTGLLPNGTSTLGWDYNEELEDKSFDFVTLPKLFRETNYFAYSFHGNNEIFYNRKIVHPNMFGFNQYYGKDTILSELGYEDQELGLMDLKEQYQHDSGAWISDRTLFNFFNDKVDTLYKENKQFMTYALTMLPHTPFYYDPYYPVPQETDLYDSDLINSIDVVTLKYINYMKYYNELFRIIFEDVNGYGDDYVYNEDSLYQRDKIAYVFYGDHGAGIKADDIQTLFGGNLDPIEIRKKQLQTLSFIYVPGQKVVTKEISGKQVSYREGLLKGNQYLVRGQTDLHRTIVDLFGLPIKDEDYLFGVHGMSYEPTYSLDNKSLNVVSDYFFGTLRNNYDYLIYNNSITLEEIERLKELIIKFKRYSDLSMNNNLYRKIKALK